MMQNLRITALQLDIVWENPQANRAKIENFLTSNLSTDVVILPEMFTTGFLPNGQKHAEKMDGETVSWMLQIARNKNIVIAGSVIIEEAEKLYNRFLWAFPDGKTEFYDKRHLFSYGKEHLHYSPGQTRRVIEFRGWRLLSQVCYDLRFPVWSRNQNDYDLAVYVASWPQQRSWVWEHLLVSRAIENQAYVVGVNRIGTDGFGLHYDGKSKIIDPTGTVISQSDKPVEQMLEATLSYETLLQWRNTFPALADGDGFTLNL